ncbi:hypothetical protein J2X68_005203 [Streptomyces sp. 3330]|uniref:allene oxide cyclase barrel-like domain-containing protein n=1 Tax=Streptomyces sp. 3330 TaxID=2817755 RepID=UPI00285DD626|nr:hypothetical protein [Streptomyces sp. 3330]MDR6978477.1 hypothetical protein [Streptomyces sp. 3330]
MACSGKLWRRSTAVLLAVLVAAAAPAAAADEATDRPAAEDGKPRERILRATSKIVQASYQGPAGFVLGATLVFSEDIFQENDRIGRNGGTCTVTATRPDGTGDAQCAITTRLSDGDITFQGRFPVAASGQGSGQRPVLAGDFEVAVTGGTGAHRTESGFMRGHPLDPMTTQVEVHLIR